MKMCKAILIICDDKDPICDFVIMRKLVRGATYTPLLRCLHRPAPLHDLYDLTHREALQPAGIYP